MANGPYSQLRHRLAPGVYLRFRGEKDFTSSKIFVLDIRQLWLFLFRELALTSSSRQCLSWSITDWSVSYECQESFVFSRLESA